MKRISIAAITVMLVAAGSVSAQVSELKIKGGEQFSYELKTLSGTVQSMQGQEMAIDATAEGSLQLTAKKAAKNAAKDRIDWNLAMTKMRLKTTGGEAAGAGMDTVISAAPADFTTDRQGNPLNKPELDETMTMALGGLRGVVVGQLFLPYMVKSMKPGESRTVTEIDTVTHPMIPGSSMYITRTTVYHYDGPVDTLKTKAARIRSEITGMSIEGTGEVMGSTLDITGDGTMNSTAYYSMNDGVLLSSASTGEMSMRMALSGEIEMMIPITQTMNTTLIRK